MDEAALSAVIDAAIRAWPGVTSDRALFEAHVRARLPEADAARALERLHAADLYLAFACLQQNRAAWRALDRQYLGRVGEFVGRIDRSPAFADEVRQRLAEKLLHDGAGAPKLALYTGRGPLGAWIRVAAVREAQNARRAARHAVDPDDVPLAAPDEDPEVQLLKKRYATEFKEALQAVLTTLSADERNVLRLHYLDAMTIEEVGRAYGVSRATAARWIAEARTKIVERIQRTLSDRFGKSAPQPESLLAFVRSQLDMSLRKHFKD
jgi:RNA polymerase sigma-70 factor (ECF subfamily)